jgi:predicted SprT family Zn-dependent metalloprotease
MSRIAKLKAIWEQLNEAHFNGELTPVPIRITRSRRTYGYFNAPSNGGRPSIRISIVLADTDELLRETMAHEMIHQALYAKNHEHWQQHGEAFQLMHRPMFGYFYIEGA